MRYRVTVPYVTRVAAEDDIIPLSNPVIGRDGKLINEIFVPKGTPVDGGLVSHSSRKHDQTYESICTECYRLRAIITNRKPYGVLMRRSSIPHDGSIPMVL